MKDITITLNPNESQVLLQLIDAAVKALGIQAAQAAIHIVKKIEDAGASGKEPDGAI